MLKSKKKVYSRGLSPYMEISFIFFRWTALGDTDLDAYCLKIFLYLSLLVSFL